MSALEQALFDFVEMVLVAVIEGMEFDASSSVRVPTILALEKYCDLVACAVGRLEQSFRPVGTAVTLDHTCRGPE